MLGNLLGYQQTNNKSKKTPELQNGMIEHSIFYTQTELMRQARGGSSASTGYATMCE